MNPSKRLDRAVTSEMETYNKLYTRMLCLIVEKFHFEVKEVDAGEKPRLSASTLRNILIPLLMSYVKEYSKAAGVG